MLFSHVKRSPLLWLHNKLHLSQPQAIEVKRFGISLVFINIIEIEIEHYMVAWRYKISLLMLKSIIHHLKRIFFITVRPCNILYLFFCDA